MEAEGIVLLVLAGVVVILGVVIGLRVMAPTVNIGQANQLKAYGMYYCNGTIFKPTKPGVYYCPPCIIYYYNNTIYSDCPGSFSNSTIGGTATTTVTSTTTVTRTTTTTVTATVATTTTATVTTTIPTYTTITNTQYTTVTSTVWTTITNTLYIPVTIYTITTSTVTVTRTIWVPPPWWWPWSILPSIKLLEGISPFIIAVVLIALRHIL